MNILMLATAVLVAGNETTRNLLSGIMWALASIPTRCASWLPTHPW